MKLIEAMESNGVQYYYDDFGAAEVHTVVYDVASPVSGTTSNSTSGSRPWPGYPSGYSVTHIAVSAVVVTAIMLVIVLGNVLVVAAVALERSLAGLNCSI